MLCYLQRYTLSADRQRINHEIAEPHGRIILYSHYSITQYVKDRIKTTASGCLKRESMCADAMAGQARQDIFNTPLCHRMRSAIRFPLFLDTAH